MIAVGGSVGGCCRKLTLSLPARRWLESTPSHDCARSGLRVGFSRAGARSICSDVPRHDFDTSCIPSSSSSTPVATEGLSRTPLTSMRHCAPTGLSRVPFGKVGTYRIILPRALVGVRCYSSEADKAVDTTTALDEQRRLRHVERRIKEHNADFEASTPDSVVGAEAETTESQQNRQVVPTAPGALKIGDHKAAALDASGDKDVVVRSRTTTGQVLWPATPEDIEILSESTHLYPAPYEVEGSVIIRLVRLSDPVTSPVGRVMRNRQFGIRGNEKWQLLAMGAVSCLLIYSLGFWQLPQST
eukprot:TRINITY_DN23833_c0_g1_i5.p1 TRINITY_DN23833_c0_g1~~TRINITY_DN23833_c0_g1_i5.p1  ORF type:complete len:301 (+),score=28.10 TRINITY_DN23833_c0_g1_i5:78-980(+)